MKQKKCENLTNCGMEIPDPKPMALPVNFQHPPSLQDQIRQMIRQEASLYASQQGKETFEESDDFDVGDDFDPTSPWELDFDPSEHPASNLKDFVQEKPKEVSPQPKVETRKAVKKPAQEPEQQNGQED